MLVPDGERHGHVDGRPHVVGGDALVVAAVTSLHARKPVIMLSMHQPIYIIQYSKRYLGPVDSTLSTHWNYYFKDLHEYKKMSENATRIIEKEKVYSNYLYLCNILIKNE